jgi:signal transduction histidine kinase
VSGCAAAFVFYNDGGVLAPLLLALAAIAPLLYVHLRQHNQPTDSAGDALTQSDSEAPVPNGAAENNGGENKAAEVLSQALDTLPQALALFDDNQNLIQANNRFKGLFPTFAARITPDTPFRDLADAMAHSGLIAEAIGDEEKWIAERCAQFAEADGEWRELAIGSRSLRISESRLKNGGVVLMHNDVTDWVDTEKELLQAKDTAELADRAKSEFLANMSHELRTPLNAVIGFSEVLRDELFGPLGDPQYYDFVNDIHDSGEHLLELIDDILDSSKMEVGQRELDAKPMDISRTIIAAVRMVNQRAERAEVAVRVETAEGIPPFNGEERGIKQILLNLLTNAIKFTPENGEISVSTQMSADGGLVITISDNGIGMLRSEIPLAFAPFVQLDSAHALQYEGTGLGLPLVKSLVEMHGGSVKIDSEVDQGTSVVVRFPNTSMVRDVAAGY